MSECCCSDGPSCSSLKQHCCPMDGLECGRVDTKTILHHLKKPWQFDLGEQNYYFCANPTCEVVYFGQDDSVILTTDLRTKVGIKEQSPESLLCYCFGVTYSEASQDDMVKEFVKEKTRDSLCACEIKNPSGKCCLKDFPK